MRIGFYNFAFAAVAASVAVGVFADDAAGALRTVTEFFLLMTTWAGGRVRRIRREDGRVDEYGYSMEGGVWTEKVTHLHESADGPVEGRTTRDFTLTNGRGETVETRTEAYVGGEWRVVARELRTHDAQGRVVRRENLAGQATTTEWDCCHKISETGPDGSATTWEYDEEDRMTASQAVPCRVHTVREGSEDSARFTTTYENMLGQTVREERSGFRGAILATVYEYDSYGRLVRVIADHEPTVEYAYDSLGARVATTRTAGRATPGAPQGGPASVPAETERRRSEERSSFIMQDGAVWLAQTNTVSCSDASIAPLVTSTARQLTGLTAANPSRAVATDERGNATETWTTVNGSIVTRSRRVPYATNVAETTLRYGDVVREVSVSGVTDTYAYDALGRQVSHTDGRGNTSRTEYNVRGLRSASIDALDNRTAYAYDRYGNLSAVTNPLGNAVVYEYDLRGRRTYEGGATYPVRYTYDVFGNKTTMTTYRNESLGPASGDVTTWRYDEASNCITNKVYADGKGPRYGYTQDGKLSQRIWARGIVTDYSYDGWGSLTNTVYSDGTPTVTLLYDAMGRQTNVVDAAGVTSFAYDDYGSVVNETVVGPAGENTIVRHWDAYGRTTGYSLVGRAAPSAPQRQTTIGYDAATGRIATMLTNGSDVPFAWSYLPGSDLKSSLAYPNGLTASWTYDANGQLLQVRNATPTDVISQYDYTYDAAGRRIEIARSGSAMSESRTDAYGYNVRNELTSATRLGGPASVPATPEYAYQYDDIGNRITSTDLGTNRTYTANSLNQYTLISNLCDSASLREEFIPQFDDDGNQTMIQTSTGIWSVQYNGENRPVLWTGGTQSAATNIVMSFDRMGRRVEYLETAGGSQSSAPETNAYHRFLYDDYLCIQRLDAANANTVDLTFVWDVTEPVTTRPLVLLSGTMLSYYTHDGNKNVAELMSYADSGLILHYDYSAFGQTLVSRHDNLNTMGIFYNPFGFSSEYSDESLGLMYFNYRHYESLTGRWILRDPIGEEGGVNLYDFLAKINNANDLLGMYKYDGNSCNDDIRKKIDTAAKNVINALGTLKEPIGSRNEWRAHWNDKAMQIRKAYATVNKKFGLSSDAIWYPKGWRSNLKGKDWHEIIQTVEKLATFLEQSTNRIVIHCREDCVPSDPCNLQLLDGDPLKAIAAVNPKNRDEIDICKPEKVGERGGFECILLHELIHSHGNVTVGKKEKDQPIGKAKEEFVVRMTQILLPEYPCK